MSEYREAGKLKSAYGNSYEYVSKEQPGIAPLQQMLKPLLSGSFF